jgi:hypothetical protein
MMSADISFHFKQTILVVPMLADTIFTPSSCKKCVSKIPGVTRISACSVCHRTERGVAVNWLAPYSDLNPLYVWKWVQVTSLVYLSTINALEVLQQRV